MYMKTPSFSMMGDISKAFARRFKRLNREGFYNGEGVVGLGWGWGHFAYVFAVLSEGPPNLIALDT